MKYIKEQSGISVVMAVLILTSVLIVSLGVADVLNQSLQISKLSVRSEIAFFAAESGAEKMIWLAKNNQIDEASLQSDCLDSYINLEATPVACSDHQHLINSDPNYYYKVKYGFFPPFHIYTISGYYYNTRRSIEVKYVK